MSEDQANRIMERSLEQRRSGHHGEALLSAYSAVQLTPANPSAWWLVALHAQQLDLQEEAIKALKTAIELAPEQAENCFGSAAS